MATYDNDNTDAIAALAERENWLAPPMQIERVTLRRWQQGVFWGLRIYIVIMLAIMSWGFYHNLSR